MASIQTSRQFKQINYVKLFNNNAHLIKHSTLLKVIKNYYNII